MRRPVVFLFLSFAFGIALGYYWNPEPFHFFIAMVFLSVLSSTALIMMRKKKMLRMAGLFAAAAVLGCLYIQIADFTEDPLERLEGETYAVIGRVITVQRKDDTAYQMLITSQDGGNRLVQVRGAMGNPAEYIGKQVAVRGNVALPPGRRNPGLFDYRLYLKTRGVRIILQCGSDQVAVAESNPFSLYQAIAVLKYSFLGKLEAEMDHEAYGLMAGMLFGDSSEIGADTYEAFQKNGIAHILSVSGIHVGIVYLCISRILGRRKTWSFYLSALFMLVFYAALSEFSPSVVRAVVMISIHMLSKILYRRYDFTACTAASAIGMLLCNPFYLFQTGFQLSYTAVFCLAAALPWTNRRIRIMEENGKNELVTGLLRWLSPLIVIQFGMAPLTAYLFNYLSLASLVLNLPVIAISSVIIPIGICLIPVSCLGGVVFGIGAQAAELLIHLMLWINQLFYLPGVSFFNVISPPVFLLLLFYGFFFFLTSEFFRILFQRGKWCTMLGICCMICAFALILPAAYGIDDRHAGLVFLDVGQGDCLHIRTPEGRNIIIDGGGSLNYEVGKKLLLPYFLKNGVDSIDLAIVTHLHADHYLGIAQLAGDMKIGQLGIYEANVFREREILTATGLQKDAMLYLTGGDRIQIGEDIWIDILYPDERTDQEYQALLSKEEEENAVSLFMKVNYKGFTVMMTGDIGFEGEQEIMHRYEEHPEILSANVLKVGHHGSRYSTGDGFLDRIGPEIAVFQVGKNNFGHPHPSVIEKCRERGIMIYRNDLDGAILFREEEQEWQIKVLLRKNMHIKE